jgi:HAD superfamily hydrolase (TIGR01509 family)
MFRPIVFDCDGVLVDSEEISCVATADLLKAHGYALDHAEIKERFLGKSMDAIYEHCVSLGRPLSPSFAEDKHNLYMERARGTLRPFPGVVEVLERLREARTRFAIATSGSPEKVAFSLEETGLRRFFDVVVTSSEVRHGKPAPDLFVEAARRMGEAPARCAVIEDSTAGIAAGLAARMLTIGFTSSLPASVLRAAGAHVTLDSMRELLALPELEEAR